MKRERDLLEKFDAVLPRLETYRIGAVPKAGADEREAHESRAKERRSELGLFSAMTGVMGALTWWISAHPWTPLWLTIPFLIMTGAIGSVAGYAFLRLAFAPRLEQALPPGTDATTALLEDELHALIRRWNVDAYLWNQAVARLRLDVSGWQLLEAVPEARDIEWSPEGSRTQASALLASIRGFVAEREALAVRKVDIDDRLQGLAARLRRLEASESAPVPALPPPREPEDDG
jgi:hypothetical protein